MSRLFIPRLSAKTVVVTAAICFTGMVALQVAWIRSAYQGELALYNKEKRQFESELQMHLKQDEAFKIGLKELLDSYNKDQIVSSAEQIWFTKNFKKAILNIAKENRHNIHPDNFGIATHTHEDSARPSLEPILLSKNESIAEMQIENAGKVCLHCILGLTENMHDEYNYQLVVFYGREQTTIFKKMGVLIAGSFLLLLVLGMLFGQMLKRYQQEKKLSEAKNDFINNLSHELQTPVFAVQMANILIKEKTTDQNEVKPLTEIIEKETHQLKQHARKILELASLENEQVELNLENTDLNAFIEAKNPTLQLILASKGGELQVKQHSDELYTGIDHVHFNNVLVSITENALKYSNGAPKLVIETGKKDDMVYYLKLTDNGIGIEKQYLPYVFDKFYRVPDVKRNGTIGFGLGLSYVRQIVILHKGYIDIKSDPGKGTSVTIYLPKSIHHE